MYYVSVQLLQLEPFFGSCTEKYNDWLLVSFSNLEGQIVIDYLLLFLFLLSDPRFRIPRRLARVSQMFKLVSQCWPQVFLVK